ncbi:hypothetical protein LPB138_05095 [Urechidicola croceus]|uniref:Uncharacterized protein n=2 Tax=Urechidicola croceus TaxID=1850246 RepID=A0A1D8P6A1_9FLAO|nr:hypothetical protein LPB138_05095 [Urechidicola croceus]
MLFIILTSITIINQVNSQVKIINNTNFSLKNINIYSTSFKSLNPKDSTDFKKFNYQEYSNNSFIQLKSRDTLFFISISPPEQNKKITLSIDSLNFKNRIIYYSEKLTEI